MLRQWWVAKHEIPWTDDRFQNSLFFDLLVEFYEDEFRRNPRAMWDAARGEDGEVIFASTGVPLFDKWERELAMGLTPDLNEGLTDKQKDKIQRIAETIEQRKRKAGGTFRDVYDQFDPKKESKFVTPGSQEEKDLVEARMLGKKRR